MLVIDAMNVLGSRPDGWWRDRDGALRRLVAEIEAWTASGDDQVLVVADGRPVDQLPPGRVGHLELRYAERAGPDAADDRIVEVVAAWAAGLDRAGAADPDRAGTVGRDAAPGADPGDEGPSGPVTVVTADRALRSRVEQLGAQVRGPRWLLDRLEGGPTATWGAAGGDDRDTIERATRDPLPGP